MTNKNAAVFRCLVVLIATLAFGLPLQAQYPASPYQPAPTAGANQNLANPNTFKQEVARLDINVIRGTQQLPMSQVPRLQKDDIVKVRLLNEAVGGVKLEQTNWDWTLIVTYVNPLINKDKQKSGSEEVNFRKSGWYKEYSFVVPYDSQPILFLSPRPKYRDEVLKIINKNSEEIQKIGEKTIELAGAYGKIQTFLNELQQVVNRNQYYGYTANNNQSNNGYNSGYNSGYNNGYSTYNSGYGSAYSNYQTGYYPNYGQGPRLADDAVERLAKSFNIQLPDCWRPGASQYNQTGYPNGYNTGYNTGYQPYNPYPNYNGGYPSYGYGNQNNQQATLEFVNRVQCIARSVNIGDFDLSVTRLWQQGGVLLVSELQKKFPQLAYYINLAAVAIDVMVRIFQKTPVRLVPTILSTPQNPLQTAYQNNYNQGGYVNNGAGYAVNTAGQNFANGQGTDASGLPAGAGKVSVYAGAQPADNSFVTAYPIVFQKWQPEADPENIAINAPVLSEPCLHAGINILKNTNLTDEWTSDSFTRDFKLVLTSDNGFRKELPLKKNLGVGGWELNLSPQDLTAFPKILMRMEGTVTGKRGFNEISSRPMTVPVAGSAKWEVDPESMKNFSVGGRRRIIIRNAGGDCRCLQSVVYKPSFGGEFRFEADRRENGLNFSLDGSQAWFEVDSTQFKPGAGTLEFRSFGGDVSSAPIKLHAAPPQISKVNLARGASEISITGERLEQIQYVMVDGFKAVFAPGAVTVDAAGQATRTAVFENSAPRQAGSYVTLQLGLDEQRLYAYPETFPVLPARPAIVAEAGGEIEGVSDADFLPSADDGARAGLSALRSQIRTQKIPVFPISTASVTLNLRNVLADYDFKPENLEIETRIEKSQTATGEYLKTDFEVLDWKTVRLKISLTGETGRILGGRRIQFRLRDKLRGDSDWYTVKQTFARIPNVMAVKCLPEMEGMCEIKGEGMEYIQQVSTDGGRSWFPEEPAFLSPQPAADGLTLIRVPAFGARETLQIRLRDYPAAPALAVTGYTFNSLLKIKSGTANNAGAKINKPAVTTKSVAASSTVEPIPNQTMKTAEPATVGAAPKTVTPAAKLWNAPDAKPAPAAAPGETMIDEIIEIKKP